MSMSTSTSTSSSSTSMTSSMTMAMSALDLSLPLTRQLEATLDEELSKAILGLEQWRASVDDSETDAEEHEHEHEHEHEQAECTHRAVVDAADAVDIADSAMPAFIHEASRYLALLRDDVRARSSSLSSHAPSLGMGMGMGSLGSLGDTYARARLALAHLAVYCPVALNVLPAISSNDMDSRSTRSRSASFSSSSAPCTPLPRLQLDLDIDTPTAQTVDQTAATTPATILSLPSPPSLDDLRDFFASESAKLSARLPSLPSMPSISSGPDMLLDQLSHAISDAKEYMHEAKDDLVEMVNDEADRLRRALHLGAQRLLSFDELPSKWRNNAFIRTGYRFIPIDRPLELAASLFTVHNETVNIYTHLIPAVYIIYYIYTDFPSTPLGDPHFNTIIDRIIALTFLLAAFCCLLLSSIWHWASGCGTWHVHHGCATLDFIGIGALISSSILSTTHQGFRCRMVENIAYNTMTVAFGLAGVYLPTRPWFNDRENKNFRISFFVGMAASGAAPVAHMMCLYGVRQVAEFYSPVVYSLLAYCAGLVLYAFDLPESIRPNRIFDHIASSHNFWHIAIVIAVALHWRALEGMNEKGLESFSCAGASNYSASQIIARYIGEHIGHSEL